MRPRADILRLQSLSDDDARSARLYRNPGDGPARLRLKLYSRVPVILSDMVPALENFGFRVIEEVSTVLADDRGHMHRFIVDLPHDDGKQVLARSAVVEDVIAAVLAGTAENDRFNALLIGADLEPSAVILFRALFRYARQTGLTLGLTTVVDSLENEAAIARAIVALFNAQHDPSVRKRDALSAEATGAIDRGLLHVASIDEDRILRLLRDLVAAIVRTNFFSPAAVEAIAFKFDSAKVPNLPRTAALARNLGLFTAYRGNPFACRPGCARRLALVRPAR